VTQPAWRAPVYQTPAIFTLVVQLYRLIAWLVRIVARHPVAVSVLLAVGLIWTDLGWVTLVALLTAAVTVLVTWRSFWPVSFARWVACPARNAWRGRRYRRRWAGVMTIAGAAPSYQGRILLPVLGKVTSTRYVDRVMVRLVSGQSAADFADHAENLAHGFGVMLCRVRTARPGAVVLEFVRRGALALLVPALPVPARPDLRALPARARPTTPTTSAMPDDASWSPANGPARPWPTTAPTARNGSFARSVFRQPTLPGTPGNL
jgi:S-DNA-T family DNA segregation ATPase FtsK/SpoIIIE